MIRNLHPQASAIGRRTGQGALGWVGAWTLLLAGCAGRPVAEAPGPGSSELASAPTPRMTTFAPASDRPPVLQDDLRLERITTAVPWPRGLAMVDGELVVLARGRHRRSGGVSAQVEDQAGSLYVVDPEIAEPVVRGVSASGGVRANGRILARPVQGPFFLWDRNVHPPDDTHMDRPYCTLAYDEASRNYFICGYSGVDLPGGKFRKNATDTVHRFDARTQRWYCVEAHDPAVVPVAELSKVAPNQHYPHHDPRRNAPPHGWLNGADGATVLGDYLYVVAKDNHCLVQYDLREIRRDPDAPPPPSRKVFGELLDVLVEGQLEHWRVMGHSALASFDGFLYVGFRTSSVIVRVPVDERGDVAPAPVAELIAVFQPWTDEAQDSANLIDVAFNSKGELFAACASRGRIWNLGRPDPSRVFDGDDARPGSPTRNQPYADLQALTNNPQARCGNILFDDRDRLYVCSGNYDADSVLAGVIYRVSAAIEAGVGSGAP